MPIPDIAQSLFKSVEWPQPGQRTQTVQTGSIITFNYTGQRQGYSTNDPWPLVIVTDEKGYIDRRTNRPHPDIVRGVNLHRIDLPRLKELVFNYAGNPNFSYAMIKGQNDWADAFRSYKRSGIAGPIKMLDVNFLKKVLSVVQALNVGEVEQIRNQIEQMMQNPEIVQPVAEPGEQIIR